MNACSIRCFTRFPWNPAAQALHAVRRERNAMTHDRLGETTAAEASTALSLRQERSGDVLYGQKSAHGQQRQGRNA